MKIQWDPILGTKVTTGFDQPETVSLFIQEKPPKKEGKPRKKIKK